MQSLYGAIANTNKKEIMVSVDKVYQKVLALANKEQRGYITPLEFNLFADQAQMEIFEQYFYDLEQFQRRVDGAAELIEDKIAVFKKGAIGISSPCELNNIPDFYKVTQINHQFGDKFYGVSEKINYEDSHLTKHSPLTKPTLSRPTFYIKDNKIYCQGEGNIFLRYIAKPISPNWNYTIASGNPLHIPISGVTQDFELHSSEENSLVLKILQLAGVAIKDFNLAQLAGQKEASITQQEKQ